MNLARRILMARRMGDTQDCAPDYDPYWDDVVLLLKGDGPDGSTNITDSSVYGHPVTVNGNAQISTAQSVYPGGSSIYFDGTGSHLAFTDTNVILDGDFTFEFYLRQTAWNNSTSGSDYPIMMYRGSTSYLEIGARGLYTRIQGSIVSSGMDYRDGNWHHIALVRKDGYASFFSDGNKVTNDVDASGRTYIDKSFHVGIYPGHSHHFYGHIDEFRITQGVARYTTDFPPPCAPFPTTGP